MATRTTVIHVHNSVTRPTSDVVLLFLRPLSAPDSSVYFAWNVLNPGPGVHQQADLRTSFSASVAAIGSPVADHTDPVALSLGTAALVSNSNSQGPAIAGRSTRSMKSDEVGLDNQCRHPATDLSVIWHVNGHAVVQTHVTPDTSLRPGSTTAFQLTQSVWMLFGKRPTMTTTYPARSFSEAVEIAVPDDATDVYVEAYTDNNGVDTFKAVTSARFLDLAQSGGLPAVMLGKVAFTNNTGGQVEVFYKVAGENRGKRVDIAPFATCAPISGTLLTIDVVRHTQRWSYDLTHYQPNGAWVEDESPYTLAQVLGHDGTTMELLVRDNQGEVVADFAPAG